MTHTQVERAAVIVQMSDGTRTLYEFKPERQITIDMGYEYASGLAFHPSHIATHLTVKGELLGGMSWHSDMPTTGRDSLPEPAKELN